MSAISDVLAQGVLTQGMQAQGGVSILTTGPFLFRTPPLVVLPSKGRRRRGNLRGHGPAVDDLLEMEQKSNGSRAIEMEGVKIYCSTVAPRQIFLGRFRWSQFFGGQAKKVGRDP